MSEKWVVITGASSGIGEAVAENLADKRYNLILVARRKDRLEELAQRLGEKDEVDAEVVALDITDKSKIEEMGRKFSDKPIVGLVNNAGLAKGVEKLYDGRPEDFDTMIDTNVKGLLYMTRAFLPGMMERGQGHIVNVGSVAGRWTYPGGAVYCASKFAVRAISEGLRMDLLGTPIRVTNIEPGMVETEFSKVRLQDEAKAKSVYKGFKPLTAADVAETIVWSMERPPHVNIQELVIYPTAQASIGMVHRNPS